MLAAQMARPQLAAVVQHRAATGPTASTGPAQGHWYVDPATGELSSPTIAYTHPQPHACFIQSVDDDLVNDGGIMDLWVREARLFKYGSGTGTNFSNLRGENEPLSGGGKSSGLMSFLKIGDRAAGAIKSGGTTRRAAKMVCLDLDHPDIEEFINWKVARSRRSPRWSPARKLDRRQLKAIMRPAKCDGPAATASTRARTRRCAAVREARAAWCPRATSSASLQLAAPGLHELDFPDYDSDWDSEAYLPSPGRTPTTPCASPTTSSTAVRERRRVGADQRRTDGKVAKTVKARDLWDQIAYAAWGCADPACSTTPRSTNGTPARQTGRINASNPCSEYMFLDNTACNLASINLMKFFNERRASSTSSVSSTPAACGPSCWKSAC